MCVMGLEKAWFCLGFYRTYFIDLSVAEIDVIVSIIDLILENKAEIPLCWVCFFLQGQGNDYHLLNNK